MESEKHPGSLPKRPEKFEGLPPSPSWPTFIEKILLALIDANPSSPAYGGAKTAADARQLRLADALKALLGAEKSAGRVDTYDLPRLMEIARMRLIKDGVHAFAIEQLR